MIFHVVSHLERIVEMTVLESVAQISCCDDEIDENVTISLEVRDPDRKVV